MEIAQKLAMEQKNKGRPKPVSPWDLRIEHRPDDYVDHFINTINETLLPKDITPRSRFFVQLSTGPGGGGSPFYGLMEKHKNYVIGKVQSLYERVGWDIEYVRDGDGDEYFRLDAPDHLFEGKDGT